MSPTVTPFVQAAPTGDVWISDFDLGVVRHLGAQQIDDDWWVNIDGVDPPPYPGSYRVAELRGQAMPGIPVIWNAPDDRFQSFVLPCIVVRRDSVDPAPERWPSVHLKYRAGQGEQVTSTWGRTEFTGGYEEYEEQYGSFPYNLMYMFSVLTAGVKAESNAQRMLKHVMKRYPPQGFTRIPVLDSLGDERTYDCTAEGPTDLKDALDIVDRQGGFALNVTVQGEIDLNDPLLVKAARSLAIEDHVGVP